MQTVREILQFIRALLGFLLNLKKKKQDGKKNETGMEPIPPDENGPDFPDVVSGGIGDNGLVGGPYRSGLGLCRSPIDTLGVRTFGRQRPAHSFTACLGWGLMAYAFLSFLGA